MAADPGQEEERSFFSLIRELPALLLELARAEVEQLKREMVRKLKKLTAASLLMVVALMLATFVIGLLLLAAVYGLHLVMPAWAAALCVAGGVTVILIIFVIASLRLFRGNTPIPTETFDSLIDDANAIRGEGDYDFD